jgi:hypothetical protein
MMVDSAQARVSAETPRALPESQCEEGFGATGEALGRSFADYASPKSVSGINDDFGVVRHVTSQSPVRRVDEFLVDLQTPGPAAQAPRRHSRRAGAGEGIDDHSARRRTCLDEELGQFSGMAAVWPPAPLCWL